MGSRWAPWVAVMSLSFVAEAQPADPLQALRVSSSCHDFGGGRVVCCETWLADATTDNNSEPPGAIGLDDSYDAVIAEIEQAKRTDDSLCHYFGPADSSCHREYHTPHCATQPKVNTATATSTGEIAFPGHAPPPVAPPKPLPPPPKHTEGPQYGRLELGIHVAFPSANSPFRALADRLSTADKLAADCFALLQTVAKAQQQDCASGVYWAGGCYGVVSPPPPGPITPGGSKVSSLFKDAYRWTSGARQSDPVAMFSPGGKFGGVAEADRVAADRTALVDKCQRILEQARKFPPVTVLELGAAAQVRHLSQTRGTGRLVFAERGALEDSGSLAAGTYPVTFAVPQADGSLRFGKVMIQHGQDPTRGQTATVTGQLGDSSESIELLTPFADRDKDGVFDKDDRCPDVIGLKTLRGCPDSDGDGVADLDDKCPNSKGDPFRRGCPDSDGDGVYDDEDNCPGSPGSWTNHGCPEPEKEKPKPVVAVAPPPSSGVAPIGRCGDTWPTPPAQTNCGHLRPQSSNDGIGTGTGDVWCRSKDEQNEELDLRCQDNPDVESGKLHPELHHCLLFADGVHPPGGVLIDMMNIRWCLP